MLVPAWQRACQPHQLVSAASAATWKPSLHCCSSRCRPVPPLRSDERCFGARSRSGQWWSQAASVCFAYVILRSTCCHVAMPYVISVCVSSTPGLAALNTTSICLPVWSVLRSHLLFSYFPWPSGPPSWSWTGEESMKWSPWGFSKLLRTKSTGWEDCMRRLTSPWGLVLVRNRFCGNQQIISHFPLPPPIPCNDPSLL